MKKLLLVFLLTSIFSYASNTTVTGTVQDPSAQVYANGTISAQFVPSPDRPNIADYTSGGSSFATVVTGTMDGAGSFSIIVTDNATINPGNSKWRFTACPKSTAPCTVTAPITITGGAQNVGATINAAAINIKIFAFNNPSYVGSAYVDGEVINPTFGTMYWNTTSNAMRVYDGAAWGNVSAAASVTSVFGRNGVVVAATNDYNYNQLAGVLPVPAVATRGGVFSKDCSAGGQFVQIISAVDGSETCASAPAAAVTSVFGRVGVVTAAANDYNFNQLAGNIAVAQMNSGTNADASHYWRGDNTWATLSAGGYAYNGVKKAWQLFDSTVSTWLIDQKPGFSWGSEFQNGCLQDGTTVGQFYCGYGITAYTMTGNSFAVDTGVTLTTGAVIGNIATIVGGATNTSIFNPARINSIQMVVKTGATVDANTMYRYGYANGTVDPPSDGIYIEKKNADTQWFLTCRSANVETRSSGMGVIATSTVYSFVLVISTSRVDVYIPGSNVSQGNCASNIPTANVSPLVEVKTNTNAARVLTLVEWYGVLDLAQF